MSDMYLRNTKEPPPIIGWGRLMLVVSSVLSVACFWSAGYIRETNQIKERSDGVWRAASPDSVGTGGTELPPEEDGPSDKGHNRARDGAAKIADESRGKDNVAGDKSWRLRYTREFRVSAYHKDADGHKWGRRYASVNFLPGGRLHTGGLNYPKLDTWVTHGHKTVAVPYNWRFLHEELSKFGEVDYHKFKLKIPGYGWAVPRDRITKHKRLDVLMHGRRADREARQWGVKTLQVEVWAYE